MKKIILMTDHKWVPDLDIIFKKLEKIKIKVKIKLTFIFLFF